MAKQMDKVKVKISQIILNLLKNKEFPWQVSQVPVNPKTNKIYSGINALLLNSFVIKRKYRNNFWATYNQWRSLRMHVSKKPLQLDEWWGIPACRWSLFENTENHQQFYLSTKYFLFNGEQVFGKDIEKYLISENQYTSHYATVDLLLEKFGAEYIHKEKQKNPVFDRETRKILLPPHDCFVDRRQFYSVLLHEMVHFCEQPTGWVGEEGQGELIAEMTTGYLESILHLPHDPDLLNAYNWLPEWVEKIEQRPEYIFEAAAQSARVLSFLKLD
jgi:antirestriction protein ArdC